MTLTRSRLAGALSACLTVLLAATMFLMPALAQAADGRVVLSTGHTDAFHVLTDSGQPVVRVVNGIRNTQYVPDETELVISSSTYGDDYTFTKLGEATRQGYFTGSENASHYFEPGWSAPGFRENGFTSTRIDFSSVEGPGRVALFANDPLSEDGSAVVPCLADNRYFVESGTTLPILGHTHAHWFFTHAGLYTMTGQAVVTASDGQELRSQPFTVRFRVEQAGQDTRPAPEPSDAPSEAPAPAPTAEPSEAPAPEPSDAPSEVPAPVPSAEPSAEPSAAPAPQPEVPLNQNPVTVDHGHIDLFNVLAHRGTLILAAKDESTGKAVLRDPAWMTLAVRDNTLRDIPARLHDRLPARGYYLPENGSTQQEALFPGWDTTQVRPDFSAVDLTIASVSGPGRVFLFSSDLAGNIRASLASGSLTLAEGEVIRQESPAHTHANWLFESPGRYTMTVQASAVSATTGKTVTSAPVTYTWIVGDPDSDGQGDTATPVPTPSAPAPAPTPAPATPTPPAPVPPSAAPGDQGNPGLPLDPDTALPVMCTPKGVDTVLSKGHLDLFNVTANASGGVDLGVKEDVTGTAVTRQPESVLVKVGAHAYTTSLPAGFPGPDHGYLLPQTQDAELVWPGWDTLGIKAAGYGATTFKVSYSGPKDGTITMAQSDAFGGFTSRLADGGFTLPASGAEIVQPFPAHSHVNWLFSKQGRYTLRVVAQATRADGTQVSSQPRTYTIDVGDVSCLGPELPPSQGVPAESGRRDQPSVPDQAGDEGGTAGSQDARTSATTGASSTQCLPTTITREATAEEAASLSSAGGSSADANTAVTTLTFNVGPGAQGNATDGHFDLGPVIEGDTVKARIKDDRQQPATWADPSSLTFALGDAASLDAPSALSFVAKPGSKVWMIPSTQIAGVPWLGMNSQHQEIVSRTSGGVTFRLESVSGPGQVAVFSAGSLGGGVGAHVFNGQGSSYTLPANTHAHQNWVFTEPGTYRLTLSMKVTPTSGQLNGSGAQDASGAGALKPTGEKGPNGRPMVEEVVGRTPDGQPCDLSLARTGSDAWSGAVASLGAVMLGGLLMAARRRRRAGA
ncbi:TIGR03773 family transporter-associated surface protein [Actinomyces faecalis]|uniref:TIGR03773 family transporter-associated surface protein n=1 Tax=Actinomyces faecalis TaxID=2722820 RepID=UPI001557C2D4|nr:TIGR03773 family transporter-associated surface protein [Actinomyces faecalis]